MNILTTPSHCRKISLVILLYYKQNFLVEHLEFCVSYSKCTLKSVVRMKTKLIIHYVNQAADIAKDLKELNLRIFRIMQWVMHRTNKETFLSFPTTHQVVSLAT